jgi:hypothetical protein
MRVAVQSASPLALGKPEALADLPAGQYWSWAVHPDGQHFISNAAATSGRPTGFHVVLNWLQELTARAAVK